jgi:hypothetical protein
MTVEENKKAIHMLETYAPLRANSERRQAVIVAISALEKQMPKYPIMKPWSISECPSCGAELGEWLEDGYHKDWTTKKVCDCGQLLTWEESN